MQRFKDSDQNICHILGRDNLLKFFDKLFGNNKTEQPTPKQKANLNYAPTQSGNVPFYSSFGDNIYASDIVVQSIRCKANEFKKLLPRHVRDKAGQQSIISNSSIAKVLKSPNVYMTTADFLEKITILLELNKNAYIYPTYYYTNAGEKVYTAMYPLKPIQASYMVDASDKYFIQFDFANGYQITLPLKDVIHWRKDYGVNDYFGGSSFSGVGENTGLLAALDRYDKLCQSIAKAVAVSCTVNGIMKINTYLSNDKIEAEQQDFVDRLANNESGILFTDLKTEYTHLPHDVKLVDSETLKFFYETILRANGTSLAILNGDYTKQQKEAYYEHALESDIKSLGQAMTKVFFTDNELAFGNEIMLYPHNITFMSMSEKIAALQAGLPAGIFTRNEARQLLGYPPIEGGDVMPRGYNNVDIVDNIYENNEETTL